MKKTSIMVIICALAVSSVAFSAFIEGPKQNISVAHAKEMKDNSSVQLKGKIMQNLGDEKYLFTDGSDTIIVEIDEDDWKGQDVSAQDIIIITGEMDKDFFGTEIDVESIQLVK